MWKVGLSQENRAFRLLFARDTLARYPAEFWKSVVFSDEKIFRTDLTGRMRVRRQRGARHEERFTVDKDSSCRDSVHRWGWIDGHGNGELHRIKGHHARDQLFRYAPGCARATAPGCAARGRAICPATGQCSPAHGATHQGLVR